METNNGLTIDTVGQPVNSLKIEIAPMSIPGIKETEFQVDCAIAEISDYQMSKEEVMEIILKFYRLTYDELKQKGRKTKIVIPRQMYCTFAKKFTKESLAEIGLYCGQDHATVIHAKNAIQNILDSHYPKNIITQYKIIEFWINHYKVSKLNKKEGTSEVAPS